MVNSVIYFVVTVIVIYGLLTVGEMLMDHLGHEAPTSPTCSWCAHRHVEYSSYGGMSKDLATEYPHLAASHNTIDNPEPSSSTTVDPIIREDV